MLALAPFTWKDGLGRDSHLGALGVGVGVGVGVGTITFHGVDDMQLHHTTTLVERYQQPPPLGGSSEGWSEAPPSHSPESDHIPSPFPKTRPVINTRMSQPQPSSQGSQNNPVRALFPYDEPLPEILGEKTALTAFGTRYVTPKAPAAKKNTSGVGGQGLGIGSGTGLGLGPGPGLAQGGKGAALSVLGSDVEAGQRQGLAHSNGTVPAVGSDNEDDDPLHFNDDHNNGDGDGDGDGSSICVDEGYGHDALDHYDYDAVDQVQLIVIVIVRLTNILISTLSVVYTNPSRLTSS